MNIQRLQSAAKMRIASVGAGQWITGTSDHRGSFSFVGFPGRGKLDDDGRVRGAWLADRFAAAEHYPLMLGGISGARLRDRKPNNHRVDRTAAGRLGFDAGGFMNITRHILSARSAAVAHS